MLKFSFPLISIVIVSVTPPAPPKVCSTIWGLIFKVVVTPSNVFSVPSNNSIAKAGFDTVNSSGVIGSKAQSVGLGLLPAAMVITGDGLTIISAVYVSSGKHPLSLFVVVTV